MGRPAVTCLVVLFLAGSPSGARQDQTDPITVNGLIERGNSRHQKGDLTGAMQDYDGTRPADHVIDG